MSAAKRRPGSARSGRRVPGGRVLEVAVVWGGSILEAQHVGSGGVGLDRAGRLLRDGEHPLARLEGEGAVVEVPGTIRVERAGGGVVELEGRVELAEGDLARVAVGRLQLLVRVLPPVPAARRTPLAQVDLYFTRVLSFSAMAAAALLCVLQVTPLGSWELADPAGRRLPRPPRVVPATPPPPHAGGPTIDAGRFVSRAAPEPRVGPRSFRQAGLIGAMEGMAAELLAPGLGGKIDDALGALQGGGPVSETHGVAGIGTRGGGGGGSREGCCGLIGGVGTRPGRGGGLDLGSGGGKGRVRIERGVTRVEGGLSKDAVGEVIRSHANQIRYCYERSLQSRPSLAGKVALSFVIDGTGHVSEALVAEDTLADPAVADCVQRTVGRWRFPEPRGGGQVLVTYPWIFRAAGAADP